MIQNTARLKVDPEYAGTAFVILLTVIVGNSLYELSEVRWVH